MPSSDSFLRQLSGREGWKSTSKRWGTGGGLKQMEGLNMYYGNGGGGDQNGGGGGMMMRKRVMVVVDQSSHSKHAMMWALTHVEVEALVIQGPNLATVMSQVKKLEVSVLVLGQKKPSSLINCLCGSSKSEELVEQCINSVECCLTIGVRKQSKGIGGYLISTRWQKNFWLLA
ncbi:hypothetical protein TEA_003340 [Camellia sinensis var. sinensis]|uniref:UspA domain-containing protein n=1 Tax=Camellia sinensis var. sinensis TaxID=542762 RepID=A0A4S4EMP0_CAMSN|nr:hypothetical protein TEA_003340 [Camellia sinensis var. sinensis]